jgi:glycosyltransferase involved in cell wall biosynthesis
VCLALLGFESQRGYQQELLEQAKALGILECVTVPGPVVGDAKEAWLQRASCFCLPSYDEGLPMAMLEAMVLGLPVVVTRVGSIPEAVAEATEGLLFEPGAIDSLADHLRALLEDPARAAAIGIAGRARVLRDFTLEASARCLHSICRQLAGLDTCA